MNGADLKFCSTENPSFQYLWISLSGKILYISYKYLPQFQIVHFHPRIISYFIISKLSYTSNLGYSQITFSFPWYFAIEWPDSSQKFFLTSIIRRCIPPNATSSGVEPVSPTTVFQSFINLLRSVTKQYYDRLSLCCSFILDLTCSSISQAFSFIILKPRVL